MSCVARLKFEHAYNAWHITVEYGENSTGRKSPYSMDMSAVLSIKSTTGKECSWVGRCEEIVSTSIFVEPIILFVS